MKACLYERPGDDIGAARAPYAGIAQADVPAVGPGPRSPEEPRARLRRPLLHRQAEQSGEHRLRPPRETP